MKVAVAITGASGVILGFRFIEELKSRHHIPYVIISENAKIVIKHELGQKFQMPSDVKYFTENDAFSPLNSSSFLLDAMVIIPCSMKTLSAVARGYANTLITRTAENVLRTDSKLIIVPRETPLSSSALENMLHLRREGAIIFPPAIAYYHKPKTISDITDFFVGKILDLLKIKNDLYNRWDNN